MGGEDSPIPPAPSNGAGESNILLGNSDFDNSNLLKSQKHLNLKSKLAWPMYTKSMKLKQNGTRAITAVKNEVFIGL